MWPATNVRIRNSLPTHLTNYSHDAVWTQSIDSVLLWLRNETHPANLAMIYFDEPDAQAHLFGPFSKQVAQEIKRADAIISYFIGQLKDFKLYDTVNLIVLSDHGMAEIEPNRVIELNKFISRDLYDMHGASPLWNILPRPGREQEVYDILLNA